MNNIFYTLSSFHGFWESFSSGFHVALFIFARLSVAFWLANQKSSVERSFEVLFNCLFSEAD